VIAFEKLAMLALGELPEAEAEEVEDHVFACTGCALILERLLDLGARIAEVTREGGAFMLASRALVDELARAGMVTRRYRMGSGGQVACTVDAKDIYTAMHLSLDVDARDLDRIDLLYESPSASYRIGDVPIDRAAGEVVFVQPAEYLRTLPSERKTVRLVSVKAAGERVVAEYTLNHTAFRPES
jgi:hypothetical protein